MNSVKNRLFLLSMFVVGFGFVSQINARAHMIHTEDKFYKALDSRRFVIAFFYSENKELKRDRFYRADLKALHRTFDRVSTLWAYHEGGLHFIKGKQDRELSRIVQQFGITSFPACALFEDGKLIEKDNKPAILYGFFSQDTLRSFIDDHIGDELAERREKKEEARERARELRRYYWGASWPYYGYPYGYYRPYRRVGVDLYL